MSLPQSIKSIALKHIQCPLGSLHSGQVMNMICVDSLCSHRGLICPICRMQKHQTHQILPIKTFLQHIRSMFTQNNNSQQLNSLTDYLRALDIAKKQIIINFKIEVKKLADSFQLLQTKIEQHFASIRKNVMIQSSITTKLPSLLTLLNEDNVNKNPQLIQEQFKKYTELLKYENNKLKVSDKAKSLVQTYALIPNKLSNLLSTISDQYIKKLQELPKLFSQKQIKNLDKLSQSTSNVPISQYTFSLDNKYYDLIIQQDNKLVKTQEQCPQGGYAFISENKGSQSQKIVFKIISNQSQSICIGLGDVDYFRDQCSFINDGSIENKVEYYDFMYCSGAIKITNDHQEGLTDFSFGNGDVVQVEYNGKEIIYFNRNLNIKHTNKAIFSENAKKNLQFLVGLLEGDQVRILDQ